MLTRFGPRVRILTTGILCSRWILRSTSRRLNSARCFEMILLVFHRRLGSLLLLVHFCIGRHLRILGLLMVGSSMRWNIDYGGEESIREIYIDKIG